MKRIIATAICAVVAMTALTVLAAKYKRPILGPENWPSPDKPACPATLAFNHPDRTYENAYTGLMFFTPDGWKFVANVFYFKLGPQYKWGLSVTAADAKNRYYFGKAEIDPNTVKFSPDSAEFSFGESYLKGRNPSYHVHYVTDTLSVDLNVKSRVNRWAPNGEGRFKFGEKDEWMFNQSFAAPWADVTGTIDVAGKKHFIKGQGYIDHGHWSVPFNRHNPKWEGFLAWTWKPVNGSMWAMQIYDYVTHPEFGGERLAVMFVVRDDKMVCATPMYNIEASDFRRDPRTKVEFPWKYEVRTVPDAPCRLMGVATNDYAWEVLDVFDELPAYIRVIARKFLKRPVYMRGFGKFNGKVQCGGEEVIFKDIPAFPDANYVQ